MTEEYFGPALPPKTADTDEAENSPKSHCKRKRSESLSSDSGSSSSSSSSSSSDSVSRKRGRLSIEEPAQVQNVPAKRYGAPDRPNTESSVNSFIGPVMPAALLTEDLDNGPDWGPKPPGDDNNVLESTAAEIERRAQRMKNRLLNKDDDEAQSDAKLERESWMMELPAVRTGNFALVARTFSMAVPTANMDRSSWTDTPADRAKKEQDLLSGKLPTTAEKVVSQESRRLQQRDSEYAQQIEEYNKSKKREKSLLELHSEKKNKVHKKKKHKKEKHKDKKKKKKSSDKDEEKEKKKKKKKEKVGERRPFDRDVDLKVNCIDDAKRQAIIKRSAQLTGRFGHGSSSGKFL